MRLLPCDYCLSGNATFSTKIKVRGTDRFPNGEPAVIGRLTSNPLYFRCSTCERTTVVTAARWNALPELTLADLKRLDFDRDVLSDYEGQGFTTPQAEDLFAAGLSINDLEALGTPVGAQR